MDVWPYEMNMWRLLRGVEEYLNHGRQNMGNGSCRGFLIDKDQENNLTLHIIQIIYYLSRNNTSIACIIF